MTGIKSVESRHRHREGNRCLIARITTNLPGIFLMEPVGAIVRDSTCHSSQFVVLSLRRSPRGHWARTD